MTDPIEAAARSIARGELVVYPTDTLYGLGARATERAAVERLYRAKQRPTDLPVSIAVSSLEEVEPWVALTRPMRAYLRRALPGPFTLLLPPSRLARRRLAPELVGAAGTVAVRVPDHPVARELARRAGPITCTSANRHGEPNPTGLRDVRRALGTAVSTYLGGHPRPSGRGSRIIDLTTSVPSVLRS
ncbi:MAG TPA: L-threonylcarbamoyladenylate synthase [Thermoplasmata archaeon]|nr:L-threonylcarbamoyladenylate synthase [Thermoplasmata archaeon]